MDVNERELPKFQHVTITFPPGEQTRLRGFYTGVLGFREKPVPKVVASLGWVWFETAVPGVELHCVPDPAPIPADTRHHFCLQVDDLHARRAALFQAGARIIEATPLPLRPRFFARDPFNNLIEFVRIEGDYVTAGQAVSL
jgi:catechol 2,3-dioxygenase-like lactoylglutathione lyase family enzyme